MTEKGNSHSIAEQWRAAGEWHARLEDGGVDNCPALASLNDVWRELDAIQQYNGKSIFDRGEELSLLADSPLAALFYSVDMGFYPPPELMLALLDCWERYLASKGGMSLDDAFLGGSTKGAGNYAKRKNKRLRDNLMRVQFSQLLRGGLSRAEAAERVSIEFPGSPDADSVLRMFRGFSGFKLACKPAEK